MVFLNLLKVVPFFITDFSSGSLEHGLGFCPVSEPSRVGGLSGLECPGYFYVCIPIQTVGQLVFVVAMFDFGIKVKPCSGRVLLFLHQGIPDLF